VHLGQFEAMPQTLIFALGVGGTGDELAELATTIYYGSPNLGHFSSSRGDQDLDMPSSLFEGLAVAAFGDLEQARNSPFLLPC
jgi:hypothetical protein